MNKLSGIIIACSYLSCFFFGYSLSLYENPENTDSSPPLFLGEIPEKTPVCSLEIQTVSPHRIEGKIHKGIIRLSQAQHIQEFTADDTFSFSVSGIFSENLPNNALFYASSRGKYAYFFENHKNTSHISPKNIIFFDSEKEAIEAGYEIKK
jgi:hypothetical protein